MHFVTEDGSYTFYLAGEQDVDPLIEVREFGKNKELSFKNRTTYCNYGGVVVARRVSDLETKDKVFFYFSRKPFQESLSVFDTKGL